MRLHLRAVKREEGAEMAVKSVRSRIRDSLTEQLLTKLNLTDRKALPKELDDQIKAYLSFYDQFWEITRALDEIGPTERIYQELSKERRQVNAAMLGILKLFGKISGVEDSFADPINWSDLLGGPQ